MPIFRGQIDLLNGVVKKMLAVHDILILLQPALGSLSAFSLFYFRFVAFVSIKTVLNSLLFQYSMQCFLMFTLDVLQTSSLIGHAFDSQKLPAAMSLKA